MRIALLGYGTVGQGVMALYQERCEALKAALGEDITFAGIGVRSLDRPRKVPAEAALFTTDTRALALDPSVDVVVEATGSTGDMGDLLEEALRAGKSVVTANKALVASRLVALSRAAEDGGASLLFEAAAGGAMPVVRVVQSQAAANAVTGIRGILNGSSNYVLSELSKARNREEVMREARELGVLEADPTDDLDGYDARNKLTILASLALGAAVRPEDVSMIGMQGITDEDLAFFALQSKKVKLIAAFCDEQASEGRRVQLSVQPTALSAFSDFAHVDGILNAAVLDCDKAGAMALKGFGGGMEPTANAMWTDLLSLSTKRPFRAMEAFDAALVDHSDVRKFYVRPTDDAPLPLTSDEWERAEKQGPEAPAGAIEILLTEERAVQLWRAGNVVIAGGRP
ncbi:MAG: homoserine dehydrogenase [Peptoniphilaceae bacterium]|nr:homoserine dehydrogenase [Peptoniphilaceae bacterium]MDY6085899.1 homoserine dehydrogenase [Peptoniphilaceae bacterium]